MAVDGLGNVYIQDSDNQRILKVSPYSGNAGHINVCPAGQNSPGPCSQTLTLSYNVTGGGTLGAVRVLTEGAANLDFTLGSGNTCTGNVTSGGSCSVDVTFAPQVQGLRRGVVQITDSNGNILAATPVYGVGVAPQVAFGAGVQSTVLGSGPGGLGSPADVKMDAAGNLYIADAGRNRVLKLAPGGAQGVIGQRSCRPGRRGPGWSRAMSSSPTPGTTASSRLPRAALRAPVLTGLNGPSGLSVDGEGNLFIADTNNDRVVRYAPDGSQTTVASGLSLPSAVAVDGAGNLFIADTMNGRVVKLPAGGGPQITVAGGLDKPTGVALDAAGDLYIAQASSPLLELPADGSSQITLGNGLTLPAGIAVDAAGDIFIAERTSNSLLLLGRAQQPPALNFATTSIGNLSSDSPQSVLVENVGNATLSGNVTVGTNFAQEPGPGAPAGCPAHFSLASGSHCNLSIDFAPTVPSAIQSSATLIDNSRNAVSATQSVTLMGTGQLRSQTISFDPIPNTALGTSITLSASASSRLPVSFSSLSPAYCSVSGTTVTLTSGGTCSIQASQAGSVRYAAAPPVTQSFTVLKNQVITFNTIRTQVVGASAALVATSLPSSGIPITFTSSIPAVCTVSGSTATMVSSGTCTIEAAQAGDSLYAAAVPVSQSFTVNPSSQSITFTGLPSTAIYGAAGPYTLSATASSGLPVSYAVTGPATLAGATLTITGAGTVTVTASQAGNANYTAATPVSLTITVSATQTITFTGLPANATYGSAGPYTLNGTASSGLPVSYAVTGPATLSGATLTITGAGTVSVTASQAGNTNYAAATPVSLTITVSTATQTITFTGLPSTAIYGAAGPYTLNGTASSGLPVSYAVTGPATLSGTTLTITGAGTVSVTASQAWQHELRRGHAGLADHRGERGHADHHLYRAACQCHLRLGGSLHAQWHRVLRSAGELCRHRSGDSLRYDVDHHGRGLRSP
ncbi:MAG: hypothetical protein WDO73_36790 [Ignavibacteriota bacterium]